MQIIFFSSFFVFFFCCHMQMSHRKDPSSVQIRQVLLEMRRYRMGLIQTADQLRFSYLAVIEGAKYIGRDGDLSLQVRVLPCHESDNFPRHCPFTWQTRATSATWHERHSVKTGRRCLCTHSSFFPPRIRGESSPTRKMTLPSSPLLLLLYLHPENHTTAKLSQRFPPKILRPSSLWRSAVWGEYQPHVSQDCTSAGCHS